MNRRERARLRARLAKRKRAITACKKKGKHGSAVHRVPDSRLTFCTSCGYRIEDASMWKRE